MQNIYNVDKWFHLKQGARADFPSVKPRRIRLEVNSPDVTQLFLINDDGEPLFLARVVGRDLIEFHSTGKISLMSDGADCFIYSSDGASIAHVVDAPVSFTKIVERRQRNPELEQMMFQMNYNLNRRLELQREDFELVLRNRLEAERAFTSSQGNAPVLPKEQPPADGGTSPAA